MQRFYFSAGTLPVSMDCLEKFGLNQEIIQLVLPLGATMNMNGTALLEGVASITIAQMAGIPLTFVQILVIRLIIKYAFPRIFKQYFLFIR